jgi:hypothetical protein
MSEPDPYAPPATSEVALVCPAHGFRREGEFIVVRSGAVLPKRCVETNEPIGQGDWSKEKKLQWFPRWAGLYTALPYLTWILLLEWLPALKDHFSFGMIAVMGTSVAIAFTFQRTCFITYSLKSSVTSRPLRVARCLNGEFWLKGCSPEFLESLDEA